MTRYADTTRCPDCRTQLPPAPEHCPRCGLPLRHPLTFELVGALQRADTLIALLHAAARTAQPEPAAAPAPPAPTPTPAPTPARGPRQTSVPALLLGLGALCLLVAAVTFLVMAWAWMGVGGRTAVLVGLTATAGALGAWLAHRGLRVAGESLSTVALGLVVLDVLGAITAGWVGQPGDSGALLLCGTAVAAASALQLAATDRLVVPQVGLPLGLVVALVGAAGTTSHDVLLATGAVLALAATARVGRLVSAPVLVWVAGAGAATWWAWLGLIGLADAASEPTIHALWAEGLGLGLAAATLLMLLPLAVRPPSELVTRASTAGFAGLLTITLAFPVVDESLTELGVVALAFLLVWTAVTLSLPARWAPSVAAPLLLSSLPAVGIVAGMALQAIERVIDVGAAFTHAADVRLAPADPVAEPLLVLPLVGALLLAAWVLSGRPRHRGWAQFAGACVVSAGLVTVASYAVPLVVITGLLAVVALTLTGLALRVPADSPGLALAALGVAAASVTAALPSDRLATGSLATASLVGALLLAARSAEARAIGHGLLPAALAGLVWCVCELADVDLAWRGLPVIAVVGLLALALPRPLLELSAAGAAVIAASAAIEHAADWPTSLALHLTLAGALVTASSLVHADRRRLGWLGGFLLAAATWVRLHDLGVEAPEAYTLPTALALVLVGLHLMWREPGTPTTVLLPGLALATVPSLLWVLAADPLAPRAVYLGLACLGLVLAGARLHWATPMLVGAVVGGLVVLREVAPYAEATPRWVLIGMAGTVLTMVGVTWERRMLELRQAAAYVGRLR